MTGRIGLVLAMCSLFVPAVGAAERAAVLPLHSEAALEPSERDALARALETALRVEGIEPVASDSVEPCEELSCIAERIEQTGASYAVELRVWQTAEARISGVSVSFVQSDGARYSSGAEVDRQHDIEDALRAATQDAFLRLQRGPGPWLDVQGRPEGAAITVDGIAVGAVPRRVKVSGGLHRVVVTHPGHDSFDETITVPRNPDAFKRLTVALREQPPVLPVAEAPEPVVATSPWNYAIAGAAVAGGALLAIGPGRSAFEDGDCGRTELGRCTGVVDFDTGEGLQLTAAGLLFAGGVAFALWAPLEVTLGATHARASLRGSF